MGHLLRFFVFCGAWRVERERWRKAFGRLPKPSDGSPPAPAQVRQRGSRDAGPAPPLPLLAGPAAKHTHAFVHGKAMTVDMLRERAQSLAQQVVRSSGRTASLRRAGFRSARQMQAALDEVLAAERLLSRVQHATSTLDKERHKLEELGVRVTELAQQQQRDGKELPALDAMREQVSRQELVLKRAHAEQESAQADLRALEASQEVCWLPCAAAPREHSPAERRQACWR